MPRLQIRVKKSAPWPDSMVSVTWLCRRQIDNNNKNGSNNHFYVLGVHARCSRWKKSFQGGTKSNFSP